MRIEIAEIGDRAAYSGLLRAQRLSQISEGQKEIYQCFQSQHAFDQALRALEPSVTIRSHTSAMTFDAGWVSTPTRSEITHGSRLADSANRPSRRTKVRCKPLTPEYSRWLAIQKRGPICRRWKCYANFLRDVGRRPSWRHLLIRQNVSGEFSPDNVKWRPARWYRSPRSTAR